MTSTLIVARSLSAAEGVRRALAFVPSCRIRGWLDGTRPCHEMIATLDVDLIVFELGDDHELALARLRDCRAAIPHAKRVLIAANLEQGQLRDAAEAGLDAAITRQRSSAATGTLIREIIAGNVYHVLREELRRDVVDAELRCLTTRELEILRLTAAGLSNSKIAGTLWITEQTVKFHLSNVYRKLGLANRTQAAHFAHTHGLVSDSPVPSARLAVAA